jgi:hypothetical protein
MLINEKEFAFLACRKPGCAHEFCWLCFGMYTIRSYTEVLNEMGNLCLYE